MNNQMRDNVISGLSNKKFDNRIEKAKKILEKSIHEYIEKITPKIPKELIEKKYICLSSNIYLANCDERSHNQHIYLDTPYYCPYHGSINIDVRDHKTIGTHYNQWELFKKQKRDFFHALKNVICNYTTVEKLLEDIPELKTELAGLLKKDKENKDQKTFALVPIEDINRIRNMINE
jgi:hypothetical protein